MERYAVSADGTSVRCLVRGSGRPLVIVPGTLAPPALYDPLVDLLARQFEVSLMERRGYGGTDPATSGPCRFDDQVADLTALLHQLNGPVSLFGHSFGGVVSLAVAAAEPALVDRLTLYEPPVAFLGDALGPMLRRCRGLHAEGRPEDAVRVAFRVSGAPGLEDGQLADGVVERLTSSVPGLLADLECVTSMRLPMGEWATIRAPVLLLRGERTTAEYRRSVAIVHSILPTADYDVLPGQAHFPSDMSVLARLIADWTLGRERRPLASEDSP